MLLFLASGLSAAAVAGDSGPPAGPAEEPADASPVRPLWRIPLKGSVTPDSVTVEGALRDGAFRPLRAVGADRRRPAAMRPLGLGPLDLAEFDLRPFGEEERARAETAGDGLRIACAAGKRPAGLVIAPRDAVLPWRPARLEWAAHGVSGFRIGLALGGEEPRDWAGAGDPGLDVPLGMRGRAARLVVLCPEESGALSLASLRLTAVAAPPRPLPRAAWVWEPEAWASRPDEILDRAAAEGIEVLFLGLDIADGNMRRPDLLGAFVSRARRRGHRVLAVEGDPAMVLPEGRAHALERAGAIRAYQESAPPDARFDGVQYDIEPYLLPDFDPQDAADLRAWRETVAELSRALDARLDIVLPFWIAGTQEGRLFVEDLSHWARGFTIMAYRTDAEGLLEAAAPLLTLAEEAGVPARVALELAPVEDELHRVYRPADAGELHVRDAPQGPVALLFEEARAPGRDSRAFRFSHEVPVPGGRISFAGRRRELERTIEVARPLLSAWSSFRELAIHGLF